jgi:hypothetical protein
MDLVKSPKRISKKPNEIYPEVENLVLPSTLTRLRKQKQAKYDASWSQNRTENQSMHEVHKTPRMSERFVLMQRLCSLPNPPFILSKSFMPHAGIGVVCNWKYHYDWKRFTLPFLEMELVAYFPWDVTDFVIGDIDNTLMNPSNNYVNYRRYLKKNDGKPKQVWRPKKVNTRDEHSGMKIACAQYINHTLPSTAPDEVAMVPATGQDLRVPNCQLVFSRTNPPYIKESARIRLRPGWELLFPYQSGLKRNYTSLEEHKRDHESFCSQLSANLSGGNSGGASSSVVLTRVRVGQEVLELQETATTLRLANVRDCPSELATCPLVHPEPVTPLPRTPLSQPPRASTQAEEEYAWRCFQATIARLPLCRGDKGRAAVRRRCTKYLHRIPLHRLDASCGPNSPSCLFPVTSVELETWHLKSLPPDDPCTRIKPSSVPKYYVASDEEEDRRGKRAYTDL